MFIIYAGNTNPYQQLLREIDLDGNTVLETNVNRINEQLLALGRRKINAFHHEARRLANGYIAVLGSDEMLVTNAQGGTVQNPVDVLGAQVIVLDQNLQLKWAWDAFDFLDIQRTAPLDEVCSAGHTGCPVFFLATSANDWLHANSIQQSPDGNIIVSLRHQDWVIKINYANGTGDGHVMWRMGYQGDFTLTNPPTSPLCTTPDQQDAFQWFGHQHDANFQFGANNIYIGLRQWQFASREMRQRRSQSRLRSQRRRDPPASDSYSALRSGLLFVRSGHCGAGPRQF